MSDILIYQQGSDVAAAPDGFIQVTNPLAPSRRSQNRFGHFPGDVYDMGSTSHISRLLKVLLGDTGVNQLHKRNLLARLQQIVGGTNFFDLDAFYGAILGVHRRRNEILASNPTTDILSPAQWDAVQISDGSYRSRIEQYARGVNLGPTARGITTVAEALLGCECDLVESWMQDDNVTQTWGGLEAVGTWGSLEALGAWGALEVGSQRPNPQRHVITVLPHRKLTNEEMYSVQYALDRAKPAGSLLVIEAPVEEAILPVAVNRADADSEHWEIRSQVRNTSVNGTLMFPGAQDALVPVPQQPWGSSQGEAWSLMGTNPSVVAYATPGDVSLTDMVDPTAVNLVPQQVSINGQSISFLPSNALLPIQATLAGRSASDGVLVCNPASGWGADTSVAPSPIASVFVDGMALDTLASVVTRDQAGREAPLFWTSPVRDASDPSNEVVEIRFSSETYFNYISFEIANFPQFVDVQVWNNSTGTWTSVWSQSFYTSNPGGITGAIPTGALHPYHYGNGHWVQLGMTVDPILSGRLRFVMKRITLGAPPVGYDGNPVPYPLGLMHADVGFRVNDQGLLPNVDSATTISTTTNLLGQAVQNSVYVYSATNTIDGTDAYWKCEAQPIRDAVVNLYLDVSDAVGNPVVLDRIFLDPLTSGPTVNVYWSNQSPSGDNLATCESTEAPVLPTLVQGNLTALTSGDQGIKWPAGTPAWFDFDNSKIGFDPTQSFWFAFEFYPNFATNTVADQATLFSSGTAVDPTLHGDVACWFTTTSLNFSVGGVVTSLTGTDWNPGQKIRVICSWDDPNGVAYLRSVSGSGQPRMAFTHGTPSGSLAVTKTIRIGRSLGSDPTQAAAFNSTLLQFALGYGKPDSTLLFDLQGLNSTETFSYHTSKPVFATDRPDRTAGTILRYNPYYEGWANAQGYSYGWMGGRLNLWSQVVWTPVAQDFVVAKGYMRLPLIRARYINLEFTNLAPQPFENMLTHSKMVNVFPDGPTAVAPNTGRSIVSDPQPVSSVRPSENPRLLQGTLRDRFERSVTTQDPYALRTSPTVGLVAADPLVAARLSGLGGYAFSFQEWQPARTTRQFTQTQQHVYSQLVIEHTAKLAYYVGLREVKVARSNPATALDTPAIIDSFFDTWGVDSYTSSYDPGGFHTTQVPSPGVLGTPQVVTGRTYASRSGVTGIQFATQQTPASQVLPDDRFQSPDLPVSTFTDTSAWHSFNDGIVLWDPNRDGVIVSRDPSITVTYVALDTPLIHRPITPVFHAVPMYIVTAPPGAIGGISSPAVPVSRQGELHVATRFTALTNLVNPIYLQLIGSDGATTLMEQACNPPINVPNECTMDYVLGSNPGLEGTIYVRVAQKGNAKDTWWMHALSCYDDGMLWEFSNDSGVNWIPAYNVRNDFAAVATFRNKGQSVKWRCTMYRQNVGINSIDIRPWYDHKVTI